jgi:uncharacterized membrane protein YkoI
MEDNMRKFWALGSLAAFILTAGSTLAAQQAATKPARQKPTAVKQATTEKEDDEKDEPEGAKAYKIAVQLPAPVTAAFKKAYPKATIRGTAKETENGKTVYEVESVENGKARDFMYAADGTVLEIEEEMNPADLPAPVTASLKRLYPKATIAVAERLSKGTAVQFELQIKGAAKKAVSFLPDGTLPAPEKK